MQHICMNCDTHKHCKLCRVGDITLYLCQACIKTIDEYKDPGNPNGPPPQKVEVLES